VGRPGPPDGRHGEAHHGSLLSHPLSQVLQPAGMVTAHGVDLALDTEVLVPAAGAHAHGRPGAAGALVHGALDHGPLADQVALMVAQADLDHLRVLPGLHSLAHGPTAARPWPRLRSLRQGFLPSLPPSMARS
jgi:hypothetical protein